MISTNFAYGEKGKIADAYASMYSPVSHTRHDITESCNGNCTKHKVPVKTGSKLGRRDVLPFAKRDAVSSAKKYTPHKISEKSDNTKAPEKTSDVDIIRSAAKSAAKSGVKHMANGARAIGADKVGKWIEDNPKTALAGAAAIGSIGAGLALKAAFGKDDDDTDESYSLDEGAYENIKSGVEKTGKFIGDTVASAGNTVKSFGNHAGHATTAVGSTAGNVVDGIANAAGTTIEDIGQFASENPKTALALSGLGAYAMIKKMVGNKKKGKNIGKKKLGESSLKFIVTDGNSTLCTNDVGESYFNQNGMCGETRIYESKVDAVKDAAKIRACRNPNNKYKVRCCAQLGESFKVIDEGTMINEGWWDSITGAVGNVAKGIGNVAGGALNAVGNVAGAAGNALTGDFDAAGKNLSGIVDAGKQAAGGLGQVASPVTDAAKAGYNAVKDSATQDGGVLNSIGNGAMNMAKGVGNVAGGALNAAGNAIGAAGKAVSGDMSGAAAQAKQAVGMGGNNNAQPQNTQQANAQQNTQQQQNGQPTAQQKLSQPANQTSSQAAGGDNAQKKAALQKQIEELQKQMAALG